MIIQALYSLLGVGRDVVVGGLERQGGGLVVDLKLGDDAQRVCTFVSSLPKELQSYALTEARPVSFRLGFLMIYLKVGSSRRRRRSERSGTPFRPAPFGTFQGNGQLRLL